MENITLGDISLAVTFLVGLIGGIGYLHRNLKAWITKSLGDQFKSLNDEIESINKRLDRVDMNSCKNFLVRSLADIEHDDSISETELERFWEQYEHYLDGGGNSYIKQRVEKLKHDGKL